MQGEAGKGHDLVFHEVYGAYYNALAKILAMAVRRDLTPAKLYGAVRDQAFGESGMYLPDRLLSGEWPFLTGDFGTFLKKEPAMPLSWLQKRWLRSLLDDPRIHLFLENDTYDRLSKQLKDVRPLYEEGTVCYFDRFLDGDDYRDPKYIDHFRTITSAIRQEKCLLVSYENRWGEDREMRVVPYSMEYSEREDKFRLYAEGLEDEKWSEPLRLNISRINACEILEKEKGPVSKTDPRKESVTIELVDDENTLERAMFHFSFLEKKTERLDNGRFRITLYFAKADETEILIRILSFGHHLNIVSEGYARNETQARLHSQHSYLRRHQDSV